MASLMEKPKERLRSWDLRKDLLTAILKEKLKERCSAMPKRTDFVTERRLEMKRGWRCQMDSVTGSLKRKGSPKAKPKEKHSVMRMPTGTETGFETDFPTVKQMQMETGLVRHSEIRKEKHLEIRMAKLKRSDSEMAILKGWQTGSLTVKRMGLQTDWLKLMDFEKG
jgi:hypothetical protein